MQGCEGGEIVAIGLLMSGGDGPDFGAFALEATTSLVALEEVSRLGAFDGDIADRSYQAVVLEGKNGAQT